MADALLAGLAGPIPGADEVLSSGIGRVGRVPGDDGVCEDSEGGSVYGECDDRDCRVEAASGDDVCDSNGDASAYSSVDIYNNESEALTKLKAKYALGDSPPDQKIIQIMSYLDSLFYAPDLEGALATLAFLGGYRLELHNPLWLMLSGASSSGKTEICLNYLLDEVAPDHKHISKLTQHTLISGLTKGANRGLNNSLIMRLGPRALVIFKDLTTLLSSHSDVVKAVAGTLREMHDGAVTNPYGTGKEVIWQGNWSIIAALTPAAERAWAEYHSQGERFLTLRWRSVRQQMDEISNIALAAMADTGSDKDKMERREKCREMVRELLDEEEGEGKMGPLTMPEPPSSELGIKWGVPQMARMITVTRTAPTKEDGKNPSYVDGMEEPGRVMKQLMAGARGLAALRRKPQVTEEECRLVRRIGWDSVPTQKRWILEAFINEQIVGKSGKLRDSELMAQTPFDSLDAMRVHLRDMLSLKIVDVNERMWELTPRFKKMMGEALRGREGEGEGG